MMIYPDIIYFSFDITRMLDNFAFANQDDQLFGQLF